MFFQEKSITVVYMSITDKINKGVFLHALSLVPKEKRKKVNSFYNDIDRKLSLYSDIIVRSVLCQKFSISNKDLSFEEGEFGKPFVKNPPDLHFNLSHTRNGIAIAFSDSPVGIDIEAVRTDEREIAERFFTVDEYNYIYSDVNERKKRFFEVWTKKEAYIKCLGKGLSISLNSFSVFDDSIRSNFIEINVDDYKISVFQEEQIENKLFFCFDEEDLLKVASELEKIEE